MITNDQEIKAAASSAIIDIISRVAGVTFSRSGSNYVCLSPFKDEKTPSFVVSPRREIFKCFASGVGGDVTKFVMEYKHYTYPEALEVLAELTNTIIDYGTGNKEQTRAEAIARRDTKERMVAAIRKAHDFYKGQTAYITGNDNSTTHIAGKDYDPAALEYWGVVTGGDYQSLNRASSTWTDRQMLIDAGLLVTKGDKGYYDFFHHRVLFPLYDLYGHIIGYNGRIYEATPPAREGKKDPPKYINSPDTLLYSKGAHVYGQYQNGREISRLSVANIVEGPTDVIQLWQYGIRNAVASSGTAFTLDAARSIAHDADMVIIMMDGDDAGIKATRRTIETCILAQLDVKVRLLPDGHDPASYLDSKYNMYMDSASIDADTGAIVSHLDKKDINQANARAYAADCLISIPAIDGIEHYAETEYPGIKIEDLSNTQKAGLLLSVTKLISYITDENIRDQYAVTIGKLIGNTTAVMKSAIRERIEDRKEAKNRLTDEQQKQKAAWDLYIDNNKYHDGNGHELSNFIIRPLFLVSYADKAKRVFEIVNKYGQSRIINMESDEFITLMGFRRKTEMLGAYIFSGSEAQYTKIRAWVYNDMREVYPIEMLGYQRSTGIYAFSNGLALPGTSAVSEVDEYGIVEHDGSAYFLPTFSKVSIRKQDDPMENEFEKSFRWIAPPSGSRCPKTLSEWSAGFARVFGKNASVALCYLIASVYRDFLHQRYDMFPHLNLFGPAGSGKTFMAQILTAAFGKPMRATHLVSSSEVAFYRRIAQSCNAIVWYEEYSEKVNPQKQEALKNFADGFGRITGKMTNDTQTKATPVHNACIISGQILPSHDPALLERCITLYFEKYYGDKSKAAYGEEFKSWSKAGYFAYVAAEIHSYRQLIEDNFQEKMEDVRDFIRSQFAASAQPSDRVLNNFAMIASVYSILARKVKLPFKDAEIYDVICERIAEQSRAVEGAEELSGFWSTLEFLIDMGANKETASKGLTDDHYAVEMVRELTIKVSEDETRTIRFEQDTKVMFLRMNYAHKMYTMAGKQQGLSRVLEIGTLKHYMQIHKCYIGEMKAKKLNKSPHRVWVFNLEYLPQYEFGLTDFTLKKDPDPSGTPAAGDYDAKGGMTPPVIAENQTEIPF